MSIAYAHGLLEDLYSPIPPGIFEYKLDWDPTLIFFGVLTFLYIRGLRAFKNKVPVAMWQQALFYVGIGFNVLALSPPIDPLADQLFFVHMIQHMLLSMVGIPLMMFGAPFFVVMRGLPALVRRRLYFPLIRSQPIRRIHSFFSHPLISLIIFNLVYWVWHIPRFYNLALLNDIIHLIEHGMMALSAIYLWRCLIDPHPLKSRLHMGLRMLFLLASMISSSILAAILSYSDTVWYAYEGIPIPKWWAYRWNHLDDQRLGGLLMWVPGSFLFLLAMTVCFFTWVQREKE